MWIAVTETRCVEYLDCVAAAFEGLPGRDGVGFVGRGQEQHSTRVPDRHAGTLFQRAPRVERPTSQLRVDLVGAVAAAQNARLIARAGARIGWSVRIDQRDAVPGGSEMMRGPGAEDTGTHHDDLRHETILARLEPHTRLCRTLRA
jgi:hypothetical protein